MLERGDSVDPQVFVETWLKRYPDPDASDAANEVDRAKESDWLREFGVGEGLTQEQVGQLVCWKFQRRKLYRQRALRGTQGTGWDKTADCIARALGAVRGVPSGDRLPLQALLGSRGGITGWGPAMASVILAVRFADCYTIADSFALSSLRWLGLMAPPSNPKYRSFYEEDWLPYLGCCRRLAEDGKRSLRDVDRALWVATEARRRVGNKP